MTPPWRCSSAGRHRCVSSTRAPTFRSMASRCMSSVSSSNLPWVPKPALFTSRSGSRPLALTVSKTRRAAPGVARSSTRNSEPGNSLASFASLSRLRAISTTLAPRRVSSLANTSPMPMEAPVTSTVFWEKSKGVSCTRVLRRGARLGMGSAGMLICIHEKPTAHHLG